MDGSRNVDTTHQSQKSYLKRNILTTYLFLFCGLLITGLSVTLFSQVDSVKTFVKDHFVFTMLGTTLLLTCNMSILNHMCCNSHKGCQTIFWASHCMITAIPILDVDPDVMTKSVIYTLVLTLILSLKSIIIPGHMVEIFVHPLSGIHSLVLVCAVYNVLFSGSDGATSHIIKNIGLHGGFLVYSGLLICNTQRLSLNAQQSNFDCMMTSFVLHTNIMNLYSRVVLFTTDPPKDSCCPPKGKVCEKRCEHVK